MHHRLHIRTMRVWENTALRNDTAHCLRFFLVPITESSCHGKTWIILQGGKRKGTDMASFLCIERLDILTIYF